MDGYKTTAEKAEEWGIEQKEVSLLCRMNMIPGAIKIDRKWEIPEDAVYDPNMLIEAKCNEKEKNKSLKKAYKTQQKEKNKINNDTNTDGSGCMTIVALIIIIVIFFTMCSGGGSSSSSYRDEPWRELGVTEKEYNQIYNYYKYGEWTS